MPFVNNCDTLIRDSKKNLFKISISNLVSLDLLNSDRDVIKKFELYNSPVNYLNVSFDITNDDIIYGIINNDDGKVLYYEYNDNNLNKSILFEYDSSKFAISYPYVKNIEDNIHVFYYVRNIESNTISALFHHYKKDDTWIENKIDFISHIVLNNFVVTFENEVPTIHYLNKVGSSEEIFASRYDIDSNSWCSPIKITNSKKSKMYLSVVKDVLNFYHISYAENINGSYAIRYINGNLNKNNFTPNMSKVISSAATCSFPNITSLDDKMYIMWIQFGKLYSRMSSDLGESWSTYIIDEYSMYEDFIRFNFRSNFIDDKKCNTDIVFSNKEYIEILGF